jgi:hypothetical protein
MCNNSENQDKNVIRDSNQFDPSSYITMARKIIEEHERSLMYRDSGTKSYLNSKPV